MTRIALRRCRIICMAGLLLVIAAQPAWADYGPAGTVTAARKAEASAWRAYCPHSQCAKMQVFDVTVVGRYALASWGNRYAGGQSLLRNDAGRWHRIGHGGRVMVVFTLERYGVPRDIALELVAHNGAARGAEPTHASRS